MDREQFLRALWLNPGLHPTLVELGIDNPGQDSDPKRRRKFEKWKKKLAEWVDAERAAAEGLELVPAAPRRLFNPEREATCRPGHHDHPHECRTVVQ